MTSWRRRGQKFPETEAQRRARAREQETAGYRCSVRTEALELLTAALPFALLEFDEEPLMKAMDALALLNSDRLHDASEETFDAPAKSCVSLDLTADQSRTLHSLPLFSIDSEENVPKLHDHRGLTLQFSFHTQIIPEMISLKEVCHQLKAGRRTIMRLIRLRELRRYHIAHRYRSAVEGVKHYLDDIATY